jgi:hypothetical protein
MGAGIAQRYSAGLRVGWEGVRFSVGAGNFSRYRIQTGSGAHPASYPMGAEGSFPEVKRPRCEADHSPQSSAEVMNVWSYTSRTQYTSMTWWSVKAQGQLYLYLTSPTFMEPEDSLPCPQEPATDSYPELDASSPQIPTLLYIIYK